MNETALGKELPKPLQRRLRFRRFSTVQLLIALALFFIFAPFVEEIKGGHLILSFLFSLVLLAAILAVADRKRVLVIAIVLAIPAIGGRWINHFRPDLVPPAVFLVTGLVLIAFVVAQSAALYPANACGYCRSAVCEHFRLSDARFNVDDGLLARGPVDARRSLFLQHERRAASINGFTGFYFSFITLSTVGYGDITPVSRIARWLAAMEAMTGSLYVAVLIARLVALYRSGEEKFHVGNSTPKSDDSRSDIKPTPLYRRGSRHASRLLAGRGLLRQRGPTGGVARQIRHQHSDAAFRIYPSSHRRSNLLEWPQCRDTANACSYNCRSLRILRPERPALTRVVRLQRSLSWFSFRVSGALGTRIG